MKVTLGSLRPFAAFAQQMDTEMESERRVCETKWSPPFDLSQIQLTRHTRKRRPCERSGTRPC
jgi:hypothetical protein